MRNITLLNRPNIDIQLHRRQGVHGDYITSFVSLDRMEGTVNITAKHDTPFDDMEIAFVGKLYPSADNVYLEHSIDNSSRHSKDVRRPSLRCTNPFWPCGSNP